MRHHLVRLVLIVLALLVVVGPPMTARPQQSGSSGLTQPAYIAISSGQATTAQYDMSIEASSALGFRLRRWCITTANATAAAAVTVTVQRRTTASTGGTTATAEGTAAPAVSKLNPADANFGGIVRITSTLGTAGAVLDGVSVQVGETGAGTADPPGPPPFCRDYEPALAPRVVAGTANGLSIVVSAAGAGGISAGSIQALIVSE